MNSRRTWTEQQENLNYIVFRTYICWVVAIACAPIQDVKGWQPPLLNELEFGSHQC